MSLSALTDECCASYHAFCRGIFLTEKGGDGILCAYFNAFMKAERSKRNDF